MIATLPHTERDPFRADVLAGLRRTPKRLPSKYFYDAIGSRLFDEITELDEYYPTRTELSILRKHAIEMAVRCGPDCLLIEPGAGSLLKARLLLDRLERPAGYVPVDVSGEHLWEAARELVARYPTLKVWPATADFTREIPVPNVPATRRIVFFPGSTLGNFDPADADQLLRRIARVVGPGGGLLIGLDLRKSIPVVEAAYNDRLGVTAAFNRNLLARINRELDADFDPDAFDHRAFYSAERSRMEMHLVSRFDQTVRVANRDVQFRAGESIHTENSYKYDVAEFRARAADCGLRLDANWTDDRGYFAVLYLTAMRQPHFPRG